MDSGYVNIALTGDANYVMPLGVLMSSIVQNLSGQYVARFFMLVSGFDDAAKEQIRQVKDCEIVFIAVEEYLHFFKNVDVSQFALPYIKSLSPYYRLLLPKVLPTDVDKCFYIDGDVAADSDLTAIYDSLSDSKLLAAVVELVAGRNYKTTLKHLADWAEFEKFNTDIKSAPYFNAGFFLMNIKLARELQVFEDCIDFLARHPNPPFCDQDTLNAICGQKYSDKMVYLPPAWNVFCDMNYDIDAYSQVFYSRAQVASAFTCPNIYHYAGGNKPWENCNVIHFWKTWWNYCKSSPFCDTKYPRARESWLSLFGCIPIARITYSPWLNKTNVYFLGLLPLVTKATNKIRFYLLGIPLLCMEFSAGNTKVYLFEIIPVVEVRRS